MTSEHHEYINAGESSFQLQSEIAHLDVAREDQLAQAELPITIPAEQVLAMKEFLVPAEGGGTGVKDTPLTYAPNFVSKVADFFAYHTRYGIIDVIMK